MGTWGHRSREGKGTWGQEEGPGNREGDIGTGIEIWEQGRDKDTGMRMWGWGQDKA